MSRILQLTVLLAGSLVTFLPTAANACSGGDRCQGKILRLYSAPGVTYVELSDKYLQNQTCTLVSGLYWQILDSAPQHEKVFASAMTAITKGTDLLLRKEVTAFPSPLDPCRISYSVLFPF